MAPPNPFDRRGVADAAFAFALVGLGAFGFRTSFGGWQFLVVSLIAAALGIGVAAVIVRYRLAPIVGAAVAIVAFVVAGGISVPDVAPAGVIPTPEVFSELAKGAAKGWAYLLTSTAPAGSADGVLVVPYLCAFAGALLSVLLGRLRTSVPLCLGPPLAVLVASVLLGIETPANLLLQGGAFAAVGIAWISARVELRRAQLVGGARSGRVVTSLGMLTVVLVVATNLGPHLPGAPGKPADRVILRDQVVPPLNLYDYASPLVTYRKYLGERLKDKELFTVTGMPDKGLVRLAVMDHYDGIVWSAVPPVDASSLASAGLFRHVGPVIPGAPRGDEAVDVTIEALADGGVPFPTSVWVPTVGAPTSIRFDGPRAAEQQRSYRFNRGTQVAATPLQLEPGDVVHIHGVVDASTTRRTARPERFATAPDDLGENRLPDELIAPYRKALEGAESDLDRAIALQDAFSSKGWYYDPDGELDIPPGHSLAHLKSFLTVLVKDQPVGNAEQYAATMALVGRMLGMQTRVVMGFRPEAVTESMTFTGDDMEAWVEIQFDDGGWVPFFPTPNRENTTTDEPKPVLINETPQDEAQTAVTTPPPRIVNLDQPRADKGKADEEPGGLGALLVWLRRIGLAAAVGVTTLAGPMALIASLKGRRSRRRRRSGTPAKRVAAGFAEALDIARDAGRPVPQGLTRVEAAQLGADPGLVVLAGAADERIFGRNEPTDADAAAMWRQVDGYRRKQLAERNRRQRIAFRANPTSLVAGRPVGDRLATLARRVRGVRLPRLRPRTAA